MSDAAAIRLQRLHKLCRLRQLSAEEAARGLEATRRAYQRALDDERAAEGQAAALRERLAAAKLPSGQTRAALLVSAERHAQALRQELGRTEERLRLAGQRSRLCDRELGAAQQQLSAALHARSAAERHSAAVRAAATRARERREQSALDDRYLSQFMTQAQRRARPR